MVLAGIFIAAAFQPNEFKVQRKALYRAKPAALFAQFSDFHAWASWSPWEKLDPAMKRTFSGAARGKGAAYAWEGNDKVGTGNMLITEVVEPSKVVLELNFLKPFEGHNKTEFGFEAKGESTELTWIMTGPMPFISKVICLFVSMDKMIGKDFEKGLENLRPLVER